MITAGFSTPRHFLGNFSVHACILTTTPSQPYLPVFLAVPSGMAVCTVVTTELMLAGSAAASLPVM